MENNNKKYSVTIPVFSEVTVLIEAGSKEEAKLKAVSQAVEENPLVSWEVDEMQEFNIERVE